MTFAVVFKQIDELDLTFFNLFIFNIERRSSCHRRKYDFSVVKNDPRYNKYRDMSVGIFIKLNKVENFLITLQFTKKNHPYPPTDYFDLNKVFS